MNELSARRKSWRRRAPLVAALATALALSLGATVAHAQAILIGPKALNGAHLGWARAYIDGPHAGNLDYMDRLRVYESAPVIDTVCHYQAFVYAEYPNGSVPFTEYSALYSGCTWAFGNRDFPNWDSYYPHCTDFGAWWDSDNTPGGTWLFIGELDHEDC